MSKRDILQLPNWRFKYLNARKERSAERSPSVAYRLAPTLLQLRPARRESSQELKGKGIGPNHRSSGKDLVYFCYQQPGLKPSACPIRKAKVVGTCYTPSPKVSSAGGYRLQHHKTRTINGQQVQALLDSFMLQVKHNLAPVGALDYTRQENLLLMNNGTC